jgi:DNA invertase Pin-like site-specific DNA recombinase
MTVTTKPHANKRRVAKAPKIRKLIAVIRVSRRNGREGEGFMSPDQQRDTIRRWAETNNVEIIAWYDETDSVSGRTTNRVGLQAAMAAVAANEADGLIVAKVDRFSRNMIEGLVAVRKLTDNAKAFVAVEDGINSTLGGRGQKLMLTLLLMFAEWHLEALTEAWHDARERHIANGVAGAWPYGYARVEDKAADNYRRLVPHPDQAKWVRQIFAWRAKGWALTKIAAELNAKEVPAPKGGGWAHTQVKAILVNNVYLGQLTAGHDDEGELIINRKAHKALITVEQFNAAQRETKTAAHNGRISYPLAGIIRCATCGGRMTGQTDRYNPAKHTVTKSYETRYYRCGTRFSWGTCTAPAMVRAEEIEAIVFARFHEDYLSGKEADGQADDAGLAAARQAKHEAETEVDEYPSLPSSIRLHRERPAAYEKAMQARLDDLVAAEAKVDELDREQFGALARLPELWPTMTTEEKRSILSRAYPVVGVRPSFRRQAPDPATGRCHIFTAGDRDLPPALPGRGGVRVFVPLLWTD